MKKGYARVSTLDQNLDRQLDQLVAAGCEIIYQEKKTGKNTDRPELKRMLADLEKDDTVIVTELTRLSRSTKDLFNLMERIAQYKANLKSLKEAWIDTTTPAGKLMFTIFAGISQFERDLIAQRTIEGLAAARARGRIGGRPRTPIETIKKAIRMYKKGSAMQEIEQETGVSKTSLYRHLKGR